MTLTNHINEAGHGNYQILLVLLIIRMIKTRKCIQVPNNPPKVTHQYDRSSRNLASCEDCDKSKISRQLRYIPYSIYFAILHLL